MLFQFLDLIFKILGNLGEMRSRDLLVVVAHCMHFFIYSSSTFGRAHLKTTGSNSRWALNLKRIMSHLALLYRKILAWQKFLCVSLCHWQEWWKKPLLGCVLCFLSSEMMPSNAKWFWYIFSCSKFWTNADKTVHKHTINMLTLQRFLWDDNKVVTSCSSWLYSPSVFCLIITRSTSWCLKKPS